MPSIHIDDRLWAEFLKFCKHLEIKDPELFLSQWLRQRLQTEHLAEGRYQLVGNAIVTDAGGQILIVGNQYDRSGPLVWGLPGGTLEIGETIYQALARELLEETGLEAVAMGRLVSISQLFLGSQATGLLAFMVRVNRWKGALTTRREVSGGLVREARFVPLEEALILLPPNFSIPLNDWVSAPDGPTRFYWKDSQDPEAVRRVGGN